MNKAVSELELVKQFGASISHKVVMSKGFGKYKKKVVKVVNSTDEENRVIAELKESGYSLCSITPVI